jgi:hypothetical protein
VGAKHPPLYHLIGDNPFSSNFIFDLLKGFDPKNPRYAESGLGCAEVSTFSFRKYLPAIAA